MASTWLWILAGVLALAVPACAYRNPIPIPLEESGSVADPGILRWMGKYYLYATKTEQPGIRCWESDDLVNWRFRSYCTGDDPVFAQRMAWNPAPFCFNGKFYLYVCGPDQKHKVMVADQPWGPFECANPDLLELKSLDAQPFLDDDGTLYLTYAGWGGIQYRKCSSPIKADGPNHQLTQCKINAQDTNVWTEGSDLVKIDGVYYLSYCGNDWVSDNYQVHTSKGASIDSLQPQAGNPTISQVTGSWVATGCSHVFLGPDLKSRWVVYHCRRFGGRERRLCLDRVHIDPKTGDLRCDGPTWTSQTNPALPTWHEDFARPKLGPSWKVASGKWTADPAGYATGDSGEMLCVRGAKADFAAEFNVRLRDPKGRYGVALCDDGKRRLELLIDVGSKSVDLRQSGERKPLASAAFPGWFDCKVWHTVFVEKQAGRLQAFVDGMRKIDTRVDTGGGVFGFIASGCAADFGWCGFSNFEEEPDSRRSESELKLISDTPLADPFVYQDGKDFYVYGTTHSFLQGKRLDRESLKSVPMDLDFGECVPKYQVWAFSVYRHTDGGYHAYATVHYGFFRTAVGHFVPAQSQEWKSGKPITRWKLDRILVGVESEGGPHAYDGEVVRDEDGTLYLVYCITPPGRRDILIAARRMLDPWNVDPAFPEQVLLATEGFRSEDRNPGFIQLVEAASISRIGGKYVMLYSVGDFSVRNYKLGVAYSDKLIPSPGETYRKVLIPDEKDLWKSGKGKEVCYLLQSEHEDWPNYCGGRVIGPGSACIVTFDRRPHLVFHGYDPEEFKRGRAERRLWSVPLDIAIGRARPVEDWIRPVLPSGGLWERPSTHWRSRSAREQAGSPRRGNGLPEEVHIACNPSKPWNSTGW